MANFLQKLIQNTKGATAIEYGLIVAIISLAGLAAYTSFGESIVSVFSDIDSGLSDKTRP